MVFETWLKTDLKKPVTVQKLSGNLFSADNEGNLIGVEVFDNGEAATLSGNVNGYVIRPDGETVLVDGTLSGNKASIVLPSSAYAVVGQESIVIKVGSVTVGACVAYVYKSTTDVIVDPSHVVPSLAELLAKIADCEAATEDANEAASLANEKATLADQKATLADQKATAANTAASSATDAASAANTAATKIDGMTASANGLNPGSSPTAVVSEVSGHKHITFGIPKGDAGKDFHIAKTFSSIAQMMAYTGTDIEAYDFAMIDTGSVQDPDTGKLYCYEPDTQDRWQYIGDLSGAQGIKGETGTGIDHITLNADYTLTIYLDDNTSYTTASIRGATGETPDISIGTVTTLNHDQQAYVVLDPSSTPEDPVFNFGIPQGEPGSAENVYGTTVPMSSTDSTKVATAIGNKLDANQGSANAGKFMRVGSTGAVSYDSPTERYPSLNDFPATGDEGKLYIAEDTGMMYVWDSEYVPVGGTSSDECEVSGDIVSFETFESKAKKLVVDIDPVQDLHGYDHPWPAGGGKNIFDPVSGSINGITFTVQSDGTVRISGTSTASGWKSVSSNRLTMQDIGINPGDSVVMWSTHYLEVRLYDSNNVNIDGKACYGSDQVVTYTVHSDAVYIMFIESYKNGSVDSGVTINETAKFFYGKGTEFTAWSPYENSCPISGWDSAEVTGTGKNLLNPEYRENLSNKIKFYKDAGYLIKAGVTYTFSISGGNASGIYFVRKSDESDIAVKYNNTSLTYTATEDTLVCFNIYYSQVPSGGLSSINCQLELGSTATTYEPYSGSTAEYEFPEAAGTVYGGTLTIHQDGSGELVVENGEVDLGTLTWTKSGTDGLFLCYGANSFIKFPQTNMDKADIICKIYATGSYTSHGDRSVYTTWADAFIKYLAVKDSTYSDSDVTAFKTAMSGAQLVYELAEPVTYQLTNQQVVELLNGQNNVWADCGSIDLTYYRTETAYQVSLNTADIAELQQDINGKADKVSSPTSGNFAALDGNGNLTDSGHKHSDYLTGKRLTAQTLTAGSTTLTFTDSAITTNSTIVPYASVWGISPTAVTVTTGQVVLTFDAMQEAISAYIEVWG